MIQSRAPTDHRNNPCLACEGRKLGKVGPFVGCISDANEGGGACGNVKDLITLSNALI